MLLLDAAVAGTHAAVAGMHAAVAGMHSVRHGTDGLRSWAPMYEDADTRPIVIYYVPQVRGRRHGADTPPRAHRRRCPPPTRRPTRRVPLALRCSS
jgi:hypothetical protein